MQLLQKTEKKAEQQAEQVMHVWWDEVYKLEN